MAFNLAVLATTDDGVAMTLRHPVTGAELVDEATQELVTITLLGRDSDAYRRTAASQQNHRLREASKGRRQQLTQEQLEAESLELLVACTTGWSGVGLGPEDPLPFSPANARRLYADPHMSFVREQAEGFIAERANFFRDSKTS